MFHASRPGPLWRTAAYAGMARAFIPGAGTRSEGRRFMTESSEDFAALLERGRRGDAAALETLSRQYEPKVRLVARVLLGPALRPYLDSLDLVQSVHHSLLLGLRQDKFAIGSPENLVALALTLLRRKVARKWRTLQRQQRLDGGPAGGDLAELLTSLSS